MSIDPKRIIAPLQAHYDKIIAVIVLAGLVFTVLLLGVRATAAKSEQGKFDGWLNGLRPTTAPVVPIDKKVFRDGYVEIDNPPQFPPSTNTNYYVPEARYTCDILVCGKPVPEHVFTCPFCLGGQVTQEVIIVKRDADEDLIPDNWEREKGMDPTNPEDAHEDLDGDGFTCWEEYRAGDEGMYGKRTHPNEKEDAPPPYAYGKLYVVETKALEFWLVFMSANRTGKTLENGEPEHKFQVNHSLTAVTQWKKLGESIEDFKLVGYKEKFVVNPATMGKKDVSELTMEATDGKKVTLVKEVRQKHWQNTATLRYVPEKRLIKDSKEGSVFTINELKYEVKKIDADGNNVLIIDTSRGDKVVQIDPRPE